MKNRYRAFRTIVRVSRHMKMLKRAGRFILAGGVGTTSPGELAIECPACPHPDKNLPRDWELGPKRDKSVAVYSKYTTRSFGHSLRSDNLG